MYSSTGSRRGREGIDHETFNGHSAAMLVVKSQFDQLVEFVRIECFAEELEALPIFFWIGCHGVKVGVPLAFVL